MRLKSPLLLLLCLLLAFSPALAPALAAAADATPALAAKDDATPADPITALNWTSYLDDSLTLDAVNIPGTHDSGTADLDPLNGRCQDLTIQAQLDMGVRFLDIRLWHTDSDRLRVVHGSFGISGITDWYFVPDVLKVCLNWLNGKNEFIVMSVKEDRGDDAEFDQHVREELSQAADELNKRYGDCYFVDDRMPALSEIRGKIVIVRRYANNSSATFRIGINARDGWGDDTYSTMTRTGYTIEVQDCYSFAPFHNAESAKLRCWMKEYDKAEAREDPYADRRDQRPHTLWFNFASGNVAGFSMRDIAQYVNPAIKCCFDKLYDTAYVRGIIPMDFVTSAVVRSIYLSNTFTNGEQQPAPMVYVEARNADGDLHVKVLDNKAPTRLQYRDATDNGAWTNFNPSGGTPLTAAHAYEFRLKATPNHEAGPIVRYTSNLTGQYNSIDYISLANEDNWERDISFPRGLEYIIDQDKINALEAQLIIYRDNANPYDQDVYAYLTGEQANLLPNVQAQSGFYLKSISHRDRWLYEPFSALSSLSFGLPSGDCADLRIAPFTPAGEFLAAGDHYAWLELWCSTATRDDVDQKYTVPLHIQIDEADMNNPALDVSIPEQKSRGNQPVEPEVTVTLTNANLLTPMTLVAGRDFDVTYFANTSPGEAWALLSGINNFESAILEPFTITGYGLTLRANGEGALINGQSEIALDNLAVVPNLQNYVPTRPGFVSRGWFWDTASTSPAAAGDALGGDAVLYVGWQKQPTPPDPDPDPTPTPIPTPTPPAPPRTGDRGQPLLWIAAAGICAVLLLALALGKRTGRRRNAENGGRNAENGERNAENGKREE